MTVSCTHFSKYGSVCVYCQIDLGQQAYDPTQNHALAAQAAESSRMPKGWICPKCEAVMAPGAAICFFCKRKEI